MPNPIRQHTATDMANQYHLDMYMRMSPPMSNNSELFCFMSRGFLLGEECDYE